MEGFALAILIGESIVLICAIWVILIAFNDSSHSGLLCLGSALADTALYVWLFYGFTTSAFIVGVVGYIILVGVVIKDFEKGILSGLLNAIIMPFILPFYLFGYAYAEWLTWRKIFIGFVIAIGLLILAYTY